MWTLFIGKDVYHNIIFNLELLLKVKKTMSPSMGEWAYAARRCYTPIQWNFI